MTDRELKTCPFCGSEAVLHPQIPCHCGAEVECVSCLARVGPIKGLTPDEGEADASAAWNSRAALSPEAQDVLPLETAPKDHTFVHLLVRYTNPATWAPLEDANVAWTIGMNGYDDTGEDVWQFVGWSWTQDCFLNRQSPGDGEPIGWLPMRSLPKVED